MRLLGTSWAAPCSAIGLLLALPVLLLGGQMRRVDHTLEVSLDARGGLLARLVDAWPFAAITFGQVILGSHAHVLASLRTHERVHVQQYQAWGPLFLLAYPASSLWQLLRGRHPYWHNHFERQAHGLDADRSSAGR